MMIIFMFFILMMVSVYVWFTIHPYPQLMK